MTRRDRPAADIGRRRLLQGGLGAGISALLPSIARAAAIAPHARGGSLEDLQHIVVFMQENRSFDHYFGTLPGVRGFGDRFVAPAAPLRE
ncbi:MAG TPA: phospholipase C, phosphocholine-specific, partial [Stenotrophomonas sp.]|nr:phospholipase C, phosphocholine-specific [Stenotrophomonas sp.]